MKKFIVVCDSVNYSHGVVQYAILLAKQGKAHLVGIVLDNSVKLSFAVSHDDLNIVRYKPN